MWMPNVKSRRVEGFKEAFGERGRIRNWDLRERCGNGSNLLERLVQRILKWFGHIERMTEGRLTNKRNGVEVGEARRRDRSKMR